jgi:antitoxin (DNA-binding transcriptional repressor) of toxin-antitoxin stability system
VLWSYDFAGWTNYLAALTFAVTVEDRTMTIRVKVWGSESPLCALLAKVEAGEEVVISRGDKPVAKLTHIPEVSDQSGVKAAIEEILAARKPTRKQRLNSGWIVQGRR